LLTGRSSNNQSGWFVKALVQLLLSNVSLSTNVLDYLHETMFRPYFSGHLPAAFDALIVKVFLAEQRIELA
jgi:hypothetical protein